jgi:hypothetical protein
MGKSGFLKLGLAGAVLLAGMAGAYAQDKPIVGLITKTEGNPFFVKARRRKPMNSGWIFGALPANSMATTKARSRPSRA